MQRNQDEYVIDNFRGLYNRLTLKENTPPGYLVSARNVVYTDKAVRCRLGATTTGTIPLNVTRSHQFRLSATPTIQRFILVDAAGNVYDNVTTGGFTPIGNIGAGNDFSILAQFDRIYISPHNRVRGIGNLFVWEPLLFPTTTTMRLAGGSPPTTPVTAVTSATAGTIQAGIHLFAVASETSSGFITPYDTAFPGGFPTYTAPGGKKVDLTVPFGDPGTVKRHILATKRIPSFDGNAEHYEFFFIAEIPDNVTAAITIDFVDSQLVDSADFLLDQLELIPAFVQMCTYQGCMIGVGEDANPSIARVSKPGEPESFQSTDGFVIVNPGEAGGLKNCSEYRGTLYLFKSFKTYNTVNNGNPPNAWPVSEVDSSLGCECYGLGNLFDDPSGVTSDALVVTTRGGVFAFDGSYSQRPLSFVIENVWLQQDFLQFSEIQVFIDPIAKLIYLHIPGSGFYSSSPNIYTLDYSDGLSWDQVRWAVWEFNVPSESLAELRSIGVVFGPTFIPRFFMVIRRPNAGDTILARVEALGADFGVNIDAIVTPQPFNPNGKPTLKVFSGGYYISEGTGTISVVGQTATLPHVLGYSTFRFTDNTRIDYYTAVFTIDPGIAGQLSINKMVLLYKDDMGEEPR